MTDVSLSFAGQTLQPLPCGALFWPAESLLLAADLHLEKGSSLAANGWFLPPYDSIETLSRLSAAVRRTGARRVALLGDSFHDTSGSTRLPTDALALLMGMAQQSEILWIAGNHDGLSAANLPGTVVDMLLVRGVALVHDLAAVTGPAMAGHLHPKVLIDLVGRRRVSRRCFAIGDDRMILPAYGAFAGGLFIDNIAFTRSIGMAPDAVLATGHGLLRLPAAARRRAA